MTEKQSITNKNFSVIAEDINENHNGITTNRVENAIHCFLNSTNFECNNYLCKFNSCICNSNNSSNNDGDKLEINNNDNIITVNPTLVSPTFLYSTLTQINEHSPNELHTMSQTEKKFGSPIFPIETSITLSVIESSLTNHIPNSSEVLTPHETQNKKTSNLSKANKVTKKTPCSTPFSKTLHDSPTITSYFVNDSTVDSNSRGILLGIRNLGIFKSRNEHSLHFNDFKEIKQNSPILNHVNQHAPSTKHVQTDSTTEELFTQVNGRPVSPYTHISH